MGQTHDIELGDLVKDEVTGVVGIAVSMTTFLAQCDRVGIQPREVKDGHAVDVTWADVVFLSVIEKGVVKVRTAAPTPAPVKTGGPAPVPQRAADPRR